MRNQSARADLVATARRRQHPLDIVVVILGVCGSSGSATVRVLGQTKARAQTVCISVQLSSVQTAPLVRPLGLPPVRHNEHHCVLSAFVVSCSCLALPPPAPLSLSLVLCSQLWPGGLFIYSFSCPCSVRLHFWHWFAMYIRLSYCLAVSLLFGSARKWPANLLGLLRRLRLLSSCLAAHSASCSAPMKSVFKLID